MQKASITKAKVQYLNRRLYRFLEADHRIEFRKMRLDRGGIYAGIYPTTVELDHRSPILPTLLHEFLHYQYPTWSETDVLRAESQWVSKLTDRQVRNILKRFALSL